MAINETYSNSGATSNTPNRCVGGCGATGPARAEGIRRPLVRAGGATVAEPLSLGSYRLIDTKEIWGYFD